MDAQADLSSLDAHVNCRYRCAPAHVFLKNLIVVFMCLCENYNQLIAFNLRFSFRCSMSDRVYLPWYFSTYSFLGSLISSISVVYLLDRLSVAN